MKIDNKKDGAYFLLSKQNFKIWCENDIQKIQFYKIKKG